jgi:hypothetical protein
MNIIIMKELNLKNVDRNDVVLMYKPELGEFHVALKKDGKPYSICKLELDAKDIGYISGGIKYLSDKVDAFVSGKIKEFWERAKRKERKAN